MTKNESGRKTTSSFHFIPTTPHGHLGQLFVKLTAQGRIRVTRGDREKMRAEGTPRWVGYHVPAGASTSSLASLFLSPIVLAPRKPPRNILPSLPWSTAPRRSPSPQRRKDNGRRQNGDNHSPASQGLFTSGATSGAEPFPALPSELCVTSFEARAGWDEEYVTLRLRRRSPATRGSVLDRGVLEYPRFGSVRLPLAEHSLAH